MPAAAALIHITEHTHDVAIDMMYARADNFTGEVIYRHAQAFELISTELFEQYLAVVA